jgi:hypothetical protein
MMRRLQGMIFIKNDFEQKKWKKGFDMVAEVQLWMPEEGLSPTFHEYAVYFKV